MAVEIIPSQESYVNFREKLTSDVINKRLSRNLFVDNSNFIVVGLDFEVDSSGNIVLKPGAGVLKDVLIEINDPITIPQQPNKEVILRYNHTYKEHAKIMLIDKTEFDPDTDLFLFHLDQNSAPKYTTENFQRNHKTDYYTWKEGKGRIYRITALKSLNTLNFNFDKISEIYENGRKLIEGIDYTVNYETGEIEFNFIVWEDMIITIVTFGGIIEWLQ